MSIRYKLQNDIDFGPEGSRPSNYVFKIDSDIPDRVVIVHKTLNQEYITWLEAGNTPEPADEE